MDYLGIDCPGCGRRRLLVDSDGVECEKCARQWDEQQAVAEAYKHKAFAEAAVIAKKHRDHPLFYDSLRQGAQYMSCSNIVLELEARAKEEQQTRDDNFYGRPHQPDPGDEGGK